MPAHGRTGLVIPVPAADALLGSGGARYPGTVRAGLLAHVSLLYPFVVAAKLDERVTTALHELFVEQVPIPLTSWRATGAAASWRCIQRRAIISRS